MCRTDGRSKLGRRTVIPLQLYEPTCDTSSSNPASAPAALKNAAEKSEQCAKCQPAEKRGDGGKGLADPSIVHSLEELRRLHVISSAVRQRDVEVLSTCQSRCLHLRKIRVHC